LFSFLIVAFALFMVVKGMNQLRRKQEEEPATEPPPSREVELLQEIRHALVKGCAGGTGPAWRKPRRLSNDFLLRENCVAAAFRRMAGTENNSTVFGILEQFSFFSWSLPSWENGFSLHSPY